MNPLTKVYRHQKRKIDKAIEQKANQVISATVNGVKSSPSAVKSRVTGARQKRKEIKTQVRAAKAQERAQRLARRQKFFQPLDGYEIDADGKVTSELSTVRFERSNDTQGASNELLCTGWFVRRDLVLSITPAERCGSLRVFAIHRNSRNGQRLGGVEFISTS